MKLLIVESPSKAKTISKYLSDLPDMAGEFIVKASVGHIRDLPKSNKKAIDIEGGFIPHYEISKGKEDVVYELNHLSKKADKVLLATDPDREGEAIAWHIEEACKLNPEKTERIVFHEITKDAIHEALQHPRKIDTDLRTAQEARRVLDRLVGYDLSGLIWKKVRYGLSAGRVQSPALRILVEREREIRAFVPHTFWVITALTKTDRDEDLLLTCTKEPTDKKEMELIIKKAPSESWVVKSVAETEAKRAPRAPFITSTLQQAASTRLGMSPSRTMRTAQKLYEAGLITYMRTDSTNLSTVALGQIQKTIFDSFGREYHEPHTFAKKSKNAQEAHEAIRPTNFKKASAGSSEDQKKLYKLIWQRTVASQMKDAKILRTKITVTIGDGSIPDFVANGSRVVYDGWLKADPAARGEDIEIPKVKEDEPLRFKKINAEEKQTQPPPRYSEAGLIKELEKRGIGRPSTYASIIKTLEDRGYMEKENRSLKPTDTGEVVSTFLEDNFMKYISDDFTAEMEDKLDAIARGEAKYVQTLEKFYGPFLKDVKSKEHIDKLTNLGVADKKHKCPACGSNMVIKLGKAGKFLSCDRFPDCEGALTIEGNEIEKEKPLGTDPETGQEVFLLHGRFGPYVQIGQKTKENPKPRRGSVPKEKDPSTVTIDDALTYLSLPRKLGEHPETGKIISASIGRFGPYIVHDTDFRSLKEDSPYEISLEKALEILKQEKKRRGFTKRKKD